MRSLKSLLLVLAFIAMPMPVSANDTQPTSIPEVVSKIVTQEQIEVHLLRQYAPLVETYIQYLRPDKQLGEVPDGDKYFLGRADLANGVELEPLGRDPGAKRKIFAGFGKIFATEFLPRGFLQMIYVDAYGFDRGNYKFDYVKREFLGDVRCLVFDLSPLPKAGKGRFVGRIWVEDQDYHIVRFNGTYGGASLTSNYLNFESWRVNVGNNLWLPAYIYSAGPSVYDAKARNLGFKPFKAQTRLWGYDLGQVRRQQDLSQAEIPAPGMDLPETALDYSPIQAERSWDRAAEDNVTGLLERQGLMAPSGEVEKVLETVINNLEVTNDLDIQPEVRCRVLMTSTLESFTVGHTIILSRGLIDVLPDEQSLAAVLAHELGHVVLRHHMDTQFAFVSRLRFDEKRTFRHFDFARTVEEEQAANKKGIELLAKSPYNEQLDSAQLFFQTLQDRSKEIPNLVSPHLGNRVETGWITKPAEPSQASEAKPAPITNALSAMPLGGHVKVDPWKDQLTFLKTKPVSSVADDEKKPFQITPFVFYLTRQGEPASAEAPRTAAVKLDTDTKP